MLNSYNPLDKFYKSVTGALTVGEPCVFRIVSDADTCNLILTKDGGDSSSFAMHKSDNCFEVELTVLERGLYFYHFDLGDGLFIGLSSLYLGEVTTKPNPFQLLVCSNNYDFPTGYEGGIIYQIFPDRFNRKGDLIKFKNRVYHDNLNDTPNYAPDKNGKVLNNDFFGGNLQGIIDKLDYLKSLSVSIIYLNPIFKSYSNHHYDTGDYLTIDPNLGTEKDLIELIHCADNLGIKIILDGVFSHTGDDSLYFNKYNNYSGIGAYQSKKSPYFKWYDFTVFPTKYSSWWGIDILPQVNELEPSYNNFINGVDGVITHYTRLGLCGWRLDVADELPSQFIKNLNKAVKSVNNNAIVIGEVWEDATNKISYGERRSYFSDEQLDSIMNYVIKNAVIEYVKTGNVDRLSYAVKEQVDHYPKAVLPLLMNLLGTHDTYRLITALAGKDMNGKTKAEMACKKLTEEEKIKGKLMVKQATLIQYTLYGMPSIYYGDEIGLEGYVDPLNRKYFTWDNIDKDLLDWFKKLGEIRSKVPALKYGDFSEVFAKDSVYVYQRSLDDDYILTAINLSDSSYKINCFQPVYDLLTGDYFTEEVEIKSGDFKLLYHDKL